MSNIEKIKAQIERLRKENGKDGRPSHVTEVICTHLLSFIDSLPEETCKENQDSFTSLEEAADEYAISLTPCDQQEELNYFNSFIAGAKWMESQMPMPEDTVIFMKGVAEGRRLEREDRNDDNLPRFYGD